MPLSQDFYEEDDFDYFLSDDEDTLSNLWNYCISLSIYSILPIIFKLIGINICFGLVVSIGKPPEKIFHILSTIIGLYLITTLESTQGKAIIIGCIISSYFLLKLAIFVEKFPALVNKLTNSIKIFYMVLLILGQHLLFDENVWSEIRGVLMIFTMKFISLFESQTHKSINVFQYFGYSCSGVNILFGPWLPFLDYMRLLRKPPSKNIWWFLSIIRCVILSLIFLTISNCWAEYFISENLNRFLVSYKEALSFRSSHYFISYLAEASMLAAGYKNSKIWLDNSKWSYSIVNPLAVEFPTSLAVVVTNWNKPMHRFLKKYVYKPWLPYGSFYAIFGTFMVSSFLHGFELRLSIVLICLGLFSFIQINFRNLIANTFDICVKVHPCKDCSHNIPRNHFKSRCLLLMFSLFTVIHLIFLGVLLDQSSIYSKWENLYFISFWIMLIKLALINL